VVEFTPLWRRRRWLLSGGALIILVALIVSARAQTSYWRDSKSLWDHTLACTSGNSVACNNLAWLLATLAPAEGGDPVRAVTLAQRACELTGNSDANSLDTLAVTYAANGRFADAIATTQTAIKLACSGGQMELLQKMEARLELYRGRQAYHPPPT
jgi:tetratricopeptide (TPR) repeat protein